jgi:hypothetical protein
VSSRLLVRRKYTLEVVETNGLSLRIEKVAASAPEDGYVISDMILNYNC